MHQTKFYKTKLTMKTENKDKDILPDYCDYNCKYANFTPPEASGACRRDITVWCLYYKKNNNKNSKCLKFKN